MNKQQSSTLVMTLAIIAATMLVSTVVVETLDLFDDAEAKKETKIKKSKNCNPSHTCHGPGGD
jgi:hypothetical protein